MKKLWILLPTEAGTWHLRIHRAFWEETIGNAGEDYCFTMPVDVTVHFDGITITVDVPEAVAEETCTPYEDYVPDEEEHRRDGEEKEQEKTTSAVFWITDGMVGGAEKIYCSERV